MKGTYLLILRLDHDLMGLPVGKLGVLDFPAGYYLYVGSAFGSGGLPARLAYHARREKTHPHWHIDYLRMHAYLEEAWYSTCAERLEHLWVNILSTAPVVQPVAPGFGAGDSPCVSHLFFSPVRPSRRDLTTILIEAIEKAPVSPSCLTIDIHTFDDV